MIDDDLRTLHIRCGSDIRDQAGKLPGSRAISWSIPIRSARARCPIVPDLMEVAGQLPGRRLRVVQRPDRGAIGGEVCSEKRTPDTGAIITIAWCCGSSMTATTSSSSPAAWRAWPRRPYQPSGTDLHRPPSGHRRFIGLGQLAPAALAVAVAHADVVTPRQLELGQAVWSALRRQIRSRLQTIAWTGTPALPIAARRCGGIFGELPGRQRMDCH